MMSFDTDCLERTITSTLVMLCKNSLVFNVSLKVQGLIGITVDEKVFLVQIDENFRSAGDELGAERAKTLQPVVKRPRNMVAPGSRRPLMSRTAPVAMRRNRGGAVVSRARQQHPLSGPSRTPAAPSRSSVASSFSSPGRGFPNMPNSECQLTPKFEPFAAAEIKQEINLIKRPSSDVICVESDEEGDQATGLHITKRRDSGRVIPKLEQNMQELVATALSKAQFVRQQSFEMTSTSTNFYSAGMSEECNTYRSDVKPAVLPESDNPSGENYTMWTPPKTKLPSATVGHIQGTPSRMQGTANQVKSEFPEMVTGGKLTHSVIRSPSVADGRRSRPQAQAQSLAVQCRPPSTDSGMDTTWTSVTQTTFVCTTGGCERRFTTKRAMVKHQRDKHFGDGAGGMSYGDCDDDDAE